MDRLPKELYALIFQHLTQKEKLECLLVNKYWHEKIKQLGALFSPLYFLYDPFKLHDAIEYFENHRDMAYQINELVYNDRHPPEYNIFVRLPVLFKNLKVFEFSTLSSAYSIMSKYGSTSNLKTWSSTLRSITESNLCNVPLTKFILNAPCPYLTHLSLKYYEPHWHNNLWERDTKETKDKLIANFKNASNLRSLALDGVHLIMQDFELIHQRLPKLRKLVLKNFTFRLNDTLDYPYENAQEVLDSNNAIIITDPLPAPLLEHLEILLFYDNDLEFQQVEVTHQWLKYIAKKYKSLSHFTLSFVTDDRQHAMYDQKPCEELVLPIINANPSLQNFEFPFAPISENMVRAMDAGGARLKSTEISAYFNDLESQLNILAESNQKEFIETVKIIIHDDVEFDPDGEVSSFSGSGPRPTLDTYGELITRPLKQFSHLKNLDVNGDKQIISIAWLPKFLEEFKNLDSVRLHHIFYAESFGTQPFVESHVKFIDLNIFIFPSVLALEPCCEQLCKMLRLCPDLQIFTIESFFFGLYPHDEVEALGGSYYALPEYEDEHRAERKITMKLDFRKNTKLKYINLDFSDKYLYVCIYRNNDKNYTLYQSDHGKFSKVRKSVPKTEYYATLYLNDNPVFINNQLFRK